MPGPTAAFLAGLMAWVCQITGLPPAPLPHVVLTADGPGHATLVRRAIPALARHQSGGMTAPDSTVYLPPDWRQGDPLDDATLAHELVHVLQFRSGRQYRCEAAMEPLAWLTQAYYLEQRGVDFWRAYRAQAMVMARAAEDCGIM